MLSEYSRYIQTLRNGLIQNGIEFSEGVDMDLTDYANLFNLGNKIDDILLYFRLLAVGGDEDALKGFPIDLGETNRDRLNALFREEFANSVLPDYKSLAGIGTLSRDALSGNGVKEVKHGIFLDEEQSKVFHGVMLDESSTVEEVSSHGILLDGGQDTVEGVRSHGVMLDEEIENTSNGVFLDTERVEHGVLLDALFDGTFLDSEEESEWGDDDEAETEETVWGDDESEEPWGSDEEEMDESTSWGEDSDEESGWGDDDEEETSWGDEEEEGESTRGDDEEEEAPWGSDEDDDPDDSSGWGGDEEDEEGTAWGDDDEEEETPWSDDEEEEETPWGDDEEEETPWSDEDDEDDGSGWGSDEEEIPNTEGVRSVSSTASTVLPQANVDRDLGDVLQDTVNNLLTRAKSSIRGFLDRKD